MKNESERAADLFWDGCLSWMGERWEEAREEECWYRREKLRGEEEVGVPPSASEDKMPE